MKEVKDDLPNHDNLYKQTCTDIFKGQTKYLIPLLPVLN